MLSFVVPCYNEEERILNTIKQIEEACEKLKIKDYKILIVDVTELDFIKNTKDLEFVIDKINI